jgi:hypothetical protein
MRYIYFILLVCFTTSASHAQDIAKDSIAKTSLFDTGRKITVIKQITIDSTSTTKAPKKDSLVLKNKHDPNKATIRSAIIPGWGQAYNREYWKIPIVYAAVGIPIGLYVYNNTWYKRTRDAYNIVVNGLTQDYNQINHQLFFEGQPLDAASLQDYRNEFRRDRDLCTLAILFAWGLNIVDATVFGHLKDFDVSPDLSLHIEPSFNVNSSTAGMGFVVNFNKRQPPSPKGGF